jgi:alpha-L-fucosidase
MIATKRLLVSLLIAVSATQVRAAVPASLDAEPPEAVTQRLAWWQNARFGLFVHWGLYSVAAGEWQGRRAKGNEHFMIHERVPLKEYATLAARFNPTRFDADAWVLAAKNAGMKYIVITTKHHEGFAMFRSPSSDYNIVKATPFGRDPMAELAEACRKHGVVLCFYYSLGRDWEDPDVPTNWPTKGGRSNTVDFPDEDKKVFARYFERKVKPQVRELLTQYCPVGVLWFDTPELISAAQSLELRAMIRELQPSCIVNERIGNKAGDYAVSEQKLDTDAGFSPWESCVTLSGGWGFNRFDTGWKTPEVVVRQLVDVASKGGNYLLNVGPTGEGEIPAPALERLAVIGRWIQVNGEAIYGCTPWTVQGEPLGSASSPAPQTATKEATPAKAAATLKDVLNDTTSQDTRPDLRFTAKGRTVYVLARSWRSGQLNVKSLSFARGIVKKVSLLGSATPVTWRQDESGLALTVPERGEVEVPVTTFRVEF